MHTSRSREDTEVDEREQCSPTVDSDYLSEQQDRGGHGGLPLGVEGLHDHHRLVGEEEYDSSSCMWGGGGGLGCRAEGIRREGAVSVMLNARVVKMWNGMVMVTSNCLPGTVRLEWY